MYEKKIEVEIRNPLEYGMQIFSGKWTLRVLCILDEKEVLRYSELRKELNNITDAVLATTLKDLIKHKMIIRTPYDEIPPRVEYSLTEKGQSLIPILNSIDDWAKPYYEKDIKLID